MTERRLRYRQVLVLLAGALIYAVLYAFCSQIDQNGVTVPGTAMPRFVIVFPISLMVLNTLFRFAFPLIEMKRTKKKFSTWGAWVLLFCCYVPMFLIQYPGSFTYDILPQAMQVAAEKYNETHPILHTLLLRACVNAYDLLGSFERCAALCSVIQMIVVSGCFACVCASLARSVSFRAAVLSLLFFAIYPSHMAMASTYTKDVMFSSFLAVFLTLHAEAVAGSGLSGRHRVLYVTSGVACGLMRSNMIYALMAWTFVMIVSAVFSKSCRRAAFGAVLVVLLTIMGLEALGAIMKADGGNVREMLSVPSQLMARARLLEPEKLTEQECAQMDGLFPGVDYTRYDPTIADPIKNCLDNEVFMRDPGAVMRLWYSVGKKCPRIYLDALLNLTLPSLYPYSSYKVSASYIEVGECRDGLTQPFGLPKIQQPGRFAAARDWLNTYIFNTGMDDIPILRYLFNTGFVFWFLLLCMLYTMYAGDWNRVLWMLLAVFLWGTYLLGPVMQGRYLYPFICVLPLFVFVPAKRAGQGD